MPHLATSPFPSLTFHHHFLPYCFSYPFSAQLKGASFEEAAAESKALIKIFHLENRAKHLGHELSGGQQRKLSFAIAACGGSKFIVLDEPTAGRRPSSSSFLLSSCHPCSAFLIHSSR